jgi:hypothetical protein
VCVRVCEGERGQGVHSLTHRGLTARSAGEVADRPPPPPEAPPEPLRPAGDGAGDSAGDGAGDERSEEEEEEEMPSRDRTYTNEKASLTKINYNGKIKLMPHRLCISQCIG